MMMMMMKKKRVRSSLPGAMRCIEPCTVTRTEAVHTHYMKEHVQIHADMSTKTPKNFANQRRAFMIMMYVNHSVTRSVSQETTGN